MRKLLSIFIAVGMVGSLVAQKKPAAPAAAPAVAAPAAKPAAAPAAPTATAMTGESKSSYTGATKRFSIGLSLGLRPDMNQLGGAIQKDGVQDNGVTNANVASTYYQQSKLLMSDKDNAQSKALSQSTGGPGQTVKDYQEGGSLTGIEGMIHIKYDLDDMIKIPLFVRTGFAYGLKLIGGSQSRTLGDRAAKDPSMAGLIASTPQLAGQTDPWGGGVMTTKYSSYYMEIPVSIGYNLRFDKHVVYFGVGASYFNGGYNIEVALDSKYASAMGAYNLGTSSYVNYSSGALTETLKFAYAGIGLHYFLGAETEIMNNMNLFFELNASGTAGVALSDRLSSAGAKLLTPATGGTSAANADPEYSKRLGQPVVLTGASVRVGVRYAVF